MWKTVKLCFKYSFWYTKRMKNHNSRSFLKQIISKSIEKCQYFQLYWEKNIFFVLLMISLQHHQAIFPLKSLFLFIFWVLFTFYHFMLYYVEGGLGTFFIFYNFLLIVLSLWNTEKYFDKFCSVYKRWRRNKAALPKNNWFFSFFKIQIKGMFYYKTDLLVLLTQFCFIMSSFLYAVVALPSAVEMLKLMLYKKNVCEFVFVCFILLTIWINGKSHFK